MTKEEFSQGARIRYSLRGTVARWQGETGTVKGKTRAGWILVDFDCGVIGVPCSALNLEPIKETEAAQ
jgi:hypothetical protein